MQPTVRFIVLNNAETIRREMKKLHVDPAGIHIMEPKFQFITLKISALPLKAALLLKQEMLARGGEAALPKEASMLTPEKVDILISGTKAHFISLTKKLKAQPFGLSRIAARIDTLMASKEQTNHNFKVGEHLLPLGERTIIMGILNVTPDSFADGGKYDRLDLALQHAQSMVEDGADIIDVGGESTRPGYQPISESEELSRVLPVIENIKKELDIPVSIDSYKAPVVKEALQAGADMVNDIWGLKADEEMGRVVSHFQVPVCLMHNRKVAVYQDLITDMLNDLWESIDIAHRSGIPAERLIIDPGIGFGKDLDGNLEVMNRLEEFQTLGLPILLGTSSKSMVGKTLNLPTEERAEGTAATVSLGIMKGADIVRVHDVKKMKRVADMTDAMVRR